MASAEEGCEEEVFCRASGLNISCMAACDMRGKSCLVYTGLW